MWFLPPRIFHLPFEQIRKDHFPPRPKHRKKRSSLAKRNPNKVGITSPSSRSSGSSGHDEKHCQQSNSGNCPDDMDTDYAPSKSSKRSAKQRRRTRSAEHANSAGDSSCSSSQELSPDDHQSTSTAAAYRNIGGAGCGSSQETFCSEAEYCAAKQPDLNLFEHNYPNSQETLYPNSEPCSQMSVTGEVAFVGHLLGKCDSVLSTTSSGYSSGVTSSESQSSEHNGNCSQSMTVGEVTDNCRLGEGSSTSTSAATITTANAMTTAKNTTAGTCSATKESVKSKKMSRKRKYSISLDDSDSDIDDAALMAKKFHAMESTDPSDSLCMICLTEKKNGAFIHNGFAHVCCCYRCTVKVWNKRKRCPICNLQVKTVLKTFVY